MLTIVASYLMGHKRIRVGAALMLAATVGWPHGATAQKPSSPPLTIQEQGSFAVGGTVIRNAGTFDSVKPGPDGQTLHGDHRACSTRCR